VAPQESFPLGYSHFCPDSHDDVMLGTETDNFESLQDSIFDPIISAMNPHPHFSNDDIVHISLLKLCSDMNLPMYAYDAIMKWSQQSHRTAYQFPRSSPRRQVIMNQLYHLYGMQNCKPILKDVNLPAGRLAQVAVFSFEDMFHSLLSDPDVWNADNLLFPENSLSPVILPNQADDLDEIVSGDWYAQAFNNLCTSPNDFLCPIVLFIDKTQVDDFSRWTVEPVLFTLAIFNRSTRNQSMAWRPLGLVTDINRSSSAQGSQNPKVMLICSLFMFQVTIISHLDHYPLS
jgi:hypothetical protein